MSSCCAKVLVVYSVSLHDYMIVIQLFIVTTSLDFKTTPPCLNVDGNVVKKLTFK